MKFRSLGIIIIGVITIALLIKVSESWVIDRNRNSIPSVQSIDNDFLLPTPKVVVEVIATPTLTITPDPSPSLAFTPSYTNTPTAEPTVKEGEAKVIGYSAAGRPLEIYTFGQGNTERVIVAGIHGGYEENTVELVDQFINYLNLHPEIIPFDKKLFILRVLNPDGLATSNGSAGRANANGVDLNRNWDAGWKEEWDPAGCWSTLPLSGGTYPHSEPEVQALASFILSHHLDALISYHSAGLGIFAGGQPPKENSINLAKHISKVSGYSYPPISGACKYTGQLIDWAANHGIAAIDVELNNHTDTDLDINNKVLSAFLGWEPK